MYRLCLTCLLWLFLAGIPCPAQQPEPLTNDSVIQMTKAGLGDSLIIQSINMAPSSFSLSTIDLIALKKAGVSERVIGAMLARSGAAPDTTGAAAPAAGGRNMPHSPGAYAGANAAPADDSAPVSLAGLDEFGIYYKSRDGQWTAMEPELVNFRSGGALKSYSTNGIIKQDRNGHIMGPSAQLALTKPVTFLLYMPAGTAPIEYLLLKLRPGAQHGREFRAETGGVFHSSSGPVRDEIAFTPKKLAAHVYQFTLGTDAAKGEYGILPPGSLGGGGLGSAGKIYTFKILE
jgi:hypothetical protein